MIRQIVLESDSPRTKQKLLQKLTTSQKNFPETFPETVSSIHSQVTSLSIWNCDINALAVGYIPHFNTFWLS